MSAANGGRGARAGEAERLLQERDLAILSDVARFRYLSSKQIERLHFAAEGSQESAARTCRRVLRQLARKQMLCRLERRIGGLRAGSASYVYALGPAGHQLLKDGKQARGRYRYLEPSSYFLDHYLEIADLVIALRAAEREGLLEVTLVETEPQCWRRFTRGLAGSETLKPDLAVATATGEYEYRWFVEIDLASHSSAAVLRKCRVYQRYWQTGIEQERCGVFPKVLILTTGERRAGKLRRALAAAHRLNRELFEIGLLASGAARIVEASS